MRTSLRRLLIVALERKERLERMRIRIDWDKSVYLVHPGLLSDLRQAHEHGDVAVLQEEEEYYLYGVRLSPDPKQLRRAPPELVVSLDPSVKR